MEFLGLVIASSGAVLIFVGARLFWRRLAARLRGGLLTGTISGWHYVGVRGMKSSPGMKPVARKYQAIVDFVDQAGIARTLQLDFPYSRKYRDDHPLGTAHVVLHDPKFPGRAYDKSFTYAYFLPFLLASAGILVLLIGLGVIFG